MKKLSPRISNPGDAVAASECYLDRVAVARRLGVKPKTISEWANQGKLPAYRIGPYLRFKWAEVEAHLAATCQLQRGVRSAERGVQNGEPAEKTFRQTHTPSPSPIRWARVASGSPRSRRRGRENRKTTL